MQGISPNRPRFRAAANAVCIVVGALWGSVGGAADGNEEDPTPPPWHPYLAPAPPLMEMDAGGPLEHAIARAARVLFPNLAEGSLPATEFGAIMVATFPPYALLFRETDGETLIETREMERGVRLGDLKPDERPGIVIVSRSVSPDIAMASISAIRRALRNAIPHRHIEMVDGVEVETVMLDGVFYYFFNRDDAGQAHSPDTDTEAGQLVRLAGVLGGFVDGSAAEPELREAVENALRANHGSTRDK